MKAEYQSIDIRTAWFPVTQTWIVYQDFFLDAYSVIPSKTNKQKKKKSPAFHWTPPLVLEAIILAIRTS